MDKKTLNLFIFMSVFLIITILIISFIKIEKYENCLLLNTNEQAKIVMNNDVYNEVKKYKNVVFLINKERYDKKIIKFRKEGNNYICIIEKIKNYKETIINISLKVKNKTIFDF